MDKLISDIQATLALMDPLWVFITIVSGLLFGYLTKDIYVSRKTLYFLIMFYLPFSLVRIGIYIAGGLPLATGTGWLGTLFFDIYAIAAYVGRKYIPTVD